MGDSLDCRELGRCNDFAVELSERPESLGPIRPHLDSKKGARVTPPNSVAGVGFPDCP